MKNDIKQFDVSLLRPTPETLETHADFDPHGRHAWLLDSIRSKGVLNPIWVRTDGTIEDGYCRVECAKLCGLEKVPGRLCGDDGEVFEASQLHRHMTLFAKCKLYRDRIEDLTRRGNELKSRNAHNANAAGIESCPDDFRENDQFENEWERVEEVLQVNRKTLQRGVRLFAEIEAIAASEMAIDVARAERLTNQFRNRGLKPTLRMMGTASATEDAGQQDDEEVDPSDRDYESDEQVPPEPEKKKPADMSPPTTASENVSPNWSEVTTTQSDSWQLDLIRYAEEQITKHDRMTAAVRKALDAFTIAICGTAAR